MRFMVHTSEANAQHQSRPRAVGWML